MNEACQRENAQKQKPLGVRSRQFRERVQQTPEVQNMSSLQEEILLSSPSWSQLMKRLRDLDWLPEDYYLVGAVLHSAENVFVAEETEV